MPDLTVAGENTRLFNAIKSSIEVDVEFVLYTYNTDTGVAECQLHMKNGAVVCGRGTSRDIPRAQNISRIAALEVLISIEKYNVFEKLHVDALNGGLRNRLER